MFPNKVPTVGGQNRLPCNTNATGYFQRDVLEWGISGDRRNHQALASSSACMRRFHNALKTLATEENFTLETKWQSACWKTTQHLEEDNHSRRT